MSQSIYWLDIYNRDPQFLSVASYSLTEAGFSVIFSGPGGKYSWDLCGQHECLPALGFGSFLKMPQLSTGIVNFLRRAARTRSVLIYTTSLRLPYIDACIMLGAKILKVNVIHIVHKPFPNCLVKQIKPSRAVRCFYGLAGEIVTLSNYTKRKLVESRLASQAVTTSVAMPSYKRWFDWRGVAGSIASCQEDLKNLVPSMSGKIVVSFLSNARQENGYFEILDYLASNKFEDIFFIFLVGGRLNNQADTSTGDSLAPNYGAIIRRRYSDEELTFLLQSSDAVITPYTAATQSSVITCALGFGCQLISTSVGACEEQIPNGMGNTFNFSDAGQLEAALNNLKKLTAKERLNRSKRYEKFLERNAFTARFVEVKSRSEAC
ncbi:glycosyl transferase, group 1 family [Luminiphilus syltensis NOR5-1B]|uniref:Glycosyl transferase, group 1 family n=1 Tax=Luminiphilus syltensis NOR5-1B TaxID=565045 RepID=B8KV09_9GAMM|nr:glycosyltransferase [Luminiphilus syltensis]EED35666.1 glycosyl transferase, group 1 family [Luminiphilus syltensis NOR5-1B]